MRPRFAVILAGLLCAVAAAPRSALAACGEHVHVAPRSMLQQFTAGGPSAVFVEPVHGGPSLPGRSGCTGPLCQRAPLVPAAPPPGVEAPSVDSWAVLLEGPAGGGPGRCRAWSIALPEARAGFPPLVERPPRG